MADTAADYASKARDTACKPFELLGRAVDATLFPGAEDRPYGRVIVDAKHKVESTVGAAEQSLEHIAEDAYQKMEVALPSLVLITWFAATVGLSFMTKWTLSSIEKGGAGFVFPVLYTLITTCACLIGCTVILAVQKKTRTLGVAQFKQSWQGILAVAFFTVLGIWASDSSVMYISLTLNQIFKATTPLPTMILGYFIERRRYVWPMVVTVLVLLVGAVLAVPFDSPDAAPYGLVLVSISTLSTAACISVKARLMSHSGDNGLTPVVLLFYSSFASVPVLLIWFLAISELPESREYFHTELSSALTVVFGASALAFCVNLLGNTLTKLTSALTVTIASSTKQVGTIIVFGVFIEHTFSSALNVIGVIIFISALVAYAFMSYNKKLMAKTMPLSVMQDKVKTAVKDSAHATEDFAKNTAKNVGAVASEKTPLKKGWLS